MAFERLKEMLLKLQTLKCKTNLKFRENKLKTEDSMPVTFQSILTTTTRSSPLWRWGGLSHDALDQGQKVPYAMMLLADGAGNIP